MRAKRTTIEILKDNLISQQEGEIEARRDTNFPLQCATVASLETKAYMYKHGAWLINKIIKEIGEAND